MFCLLEALEIKPCGFESRIRIWRLKSEVKINYAHVITKGNCNKFIEVKFCVGLCANWRKLRECVFWSSNA